MTKYKDNINNSDSTEYIVLKSLIKELVEYPSDVDIKEIQSNSVDSTTTLYSISVNSNDKGKIIGRSGRLIHAIRILFASIGLKKGKKLFIELVE